MSKQHAGTTIPRHKNLYIQVLRGFAISAVVLIHSLPPNHEWVLVLRPFLNFGVALFLFLSGYLTPKNKCQNIGKFYKRRIGKILIPYLLWSIAYCILYRIWDPSNILSSLLTGSAAPQMYYLLVYAQLVLITPLLYRIVDMGWGWILWAITPCTLLVREIVAANDKIIPHIGAFFGSWIIFYLFGMYWSAISKHLLRSWASSMLYTITLCLQIYASFLWNKAGNFDLATTQLKITSMLSSLVFIVVLMQISETAKTQLAGVRILTLIGDCSYGIYLCHMVILWLTVRMSRLIGFDSTTVIGTFLLWATTLILSLALVRVCQLLLPTKVQIGIGFE